MKNNQLLEKEKKYFSGHISEWVVYYPGKYVLIKGEQFCGIFESTEDALAEGVRLFGKESFLVRKIEKHELCELPSFALGIFCGEYSCPV
jgi:hypothetical protein